MSFAVLRWITNGTIASVMAGSLWLAQAVDPNRAVQGLQVATASAAVLPAADAASGAAR